jgi:hypothetical protein
MHHTIPGVFMFTKSADKNQEKLGDMEGSFGGAINPSEHPVIETAKKIRSTNQRCHTQPL